MTFVKYWAIFKMAAIVNL